MTGRVTLGELLDAAREHLDQAGSVPGRPGEGRDLMHVTGGMHALVVVMGRYLQDGPGGHGHVPQRNGEQASPWPAARAQARRAAASAARRLRPPLVTGRTGAAQLTERGLHLDAAARALAAGRDLLATHVMSDPGGALVARSIWAPVICSPAVGRAVAAEMGALARQAAALGAGLVMVTPAEWPEISQSRQDLAAACQYLRMLAGAVRAAHQQEPVLAGDRELLRAIPSAVVSPRRLRDGSEPVAALCQGVISAAERLCQSARIAAGRAGWSPHLSAESLRHAAAASVATSHHCAVLLGALADRSRAADGGQAWAAVGLPVAVTGAAEAAGRARDGWLRVTRMLDQITSDVRALVPQDAVDAQDLALWTGRLAYADQQWVLASGPRQAERPVEELAPWPDDARLVIAAVHHTGDSLLRLAEAHERQARSAARAGRLLVPTRSLPDGYDIPLPYGPAPPERIGVVLSVYRHAREASSKAEAQVAKIAAETRSPSRVLTLARAVASGSAPDRQPGGQGRREGLFAEVAVYEPPSVPGPVERSLQMLGVTDPCQFRHAVVIDRAGEQLIIDASTERESHSGRSAALRTSANRMTYHSLASGNRAMTPMPGPKAPPQREQPERQPE